MRSIRDFVILLSAAIMLLLGCSALAHMLKLAQAAAADSLGTQDERPLAKGVISAFAPSRPDLAGVVGRIVTRATIGPDTP